MTSINIIPLFLNIINVVIKAAEIDTINRNPKSSSTDDGKIIDFSLSLFSGIFYLTLLLPLGKKVFHLIL